MGWNSHTISVLVQGLSRATFFPIFAIFSRKSTFFARKSTFFLISLKRLNRLGWNSHTTSVLVQGLSRATSFFDSHNIFAKIDLFRAKIDVFFYFLKNGRTDWAEIHTQHPCWSRDCFILISGDSPRIIVIACFIFIYNINLFYQLYFLLLFYQYYFLSLFY